MKPESRRPSLITRVDEASFKLMELFRFPLWFTQLWTWCHTSATTKYGSSFFSYCS